MGKVGFTTTVPVEVVLAAGLVPVDLNNVFMASSDPAGMVEQAEAEGLPRTSCGWIKGLYIAAKQAGVKDVIAVTEGDCSNTHALMELWQSDGLRVAPFAYPYNRDRDLLRLHIRELMDAFGADEQAVIRKFIELKPLREDLRRLDEMTWKDCKVTGAENHRWLVSSSDFEGNPASYGERLKAFLSEAANREPLHTEQGVCIGCIGVPPIFYDFHEVIESAGAAVVFNETQRQFSMPNDARDIYEQYALYTYPYDVFGRIADIKKQLKLRRIDGIVHYCQSFCHRAIEDILIRRGVGLPVLTVEGDRPGPVDARTRIRMEGFVEMLRDRKG